MSHTVAALLQQNKLDEELARLPARTLLLFSRKNKFRRLCTYLHNNKVFNGFVLSCIAVNCVFLAMYNPVWPEDPRNQFAENADNYLIIVFAIEMVASIVSDGFFRDKNSYLRSGWNWLDFVLVVTGFLSFFNLENLTGLRAFRLLRPLRAVTRIPEIRILVKTLFSALPQLIKVMALFIFLMVIFGIVGLEIMIGKLHYRCVDNFSGDILIDQMCSPDSSSFQCPSTHSCLKMSPNPYYGFANFDNLGSAFLVIFQSVTMDNWYDLVGLYMDAMDPSVCVYFVSIVLIGSYLIVNLALVTVNSTFQKNVAKEKSRIEREKRLGRGMAAKLNRLDHTAKIAKNQKHAERLRSGRMDDNSFLLERIDTSTAWGRFRHSVRKFAKTPIFQRMVTVAILVNFLSMATESYPMTESHAQTLNDIDFAMSIIFLVEMLLKQIGFGLTAYFKDRFNCFDCFVVILGIIDLLINQNLVIFKTLRLLRFFKLARAWKSLRDLLTIVVHSMKAVSYMGALVVLILFIFTLIGMQFFGGNVTSSSRLTFDTLFSGWITVFSVLTGENWSRSMYEHMAYTPFAAAFFIILFVISNYLFLNVFIAILISKFSERETLVTRTGSVGNLRTLKSFVSFTASKFLFCNKWRKRSRIQNMQKTPTNAAAKFIPDSARMFHGIRATDSDNEFFDNRLYLRSSIVEMGPLFSRERFNENEDQIQSTQQSLEMEARDLAVLANEKRKAFLEESLERANADAANTLLVGAISSPSHSSTPLAAGGVLSAPPKLKADEGNEEPVVSRGSSTECLTPSSKHLTRRRMNNASLLPSDPSPEPLASLLHLQKRPTLPPIIIATTPNADSSTLQPPPLSSTRDPAASFSFVQPPLGLTYVTKAEELLQSERDSNPQPARPESIASTASTHSAGEKESVNDVSTTSRDSLSMSESVQARRQLLRKKRMQQLPTTAPTSMFVSDGENWARRQSPARPNSRVSTGQGRSLSPIPPTTPRGQLARTRSPLTHRRPLTAGPTPRSISNSEVTVLEEGKRLLIKKQMSPVFTPPVKHDNEKCCQNRSHMHPGGGATTATTDAAIASANAATTTIQNQLSLPSENRQIRRRSTHEEEMEKAQTFINEMLASSRTPSPQFIPSVSPSPIGGKKHSIESAQLDFLESTLRELSSPIHLGRYERVIEPITITGHESSHEHEGDEEEVEEDVTVTPPELADHEPPPQTAASSTHPTDSLVISMPLSKHSSNHSLSADSDTPFIPSHQHQQHSLPAPLQIESSSGASTNVFSSFLSRFSRKTNKVGTMVRDDEHSNSFPLSSSTVGGANTGTPRPDIEAWISLSPLPVSYSPTPSSLRRHRSFSSRISHAFSYENTSSLWLMSEEHPIRKFLTEKLLEKRYFEWFVQTAILISCITIACDSPASRADPTFSTILSTVEYIINGAFMLECTIKVLAQGFVIHEGAYLRSSWSVLDFLIVVTSAVSMADTGSHIASSVRSLRVLRALRPLRLINANPQLRLIVDSLIGSIPAVGDVLLVTVLLFLIFAVMGVQLFSGIMHACTDPSITNASECAGEYISSSGEILWRSWEPLPNNFDNLPQAVLTLFRLMTQDNWQDVMFIAVDTPGIGQSPVENSNPASALFFIVWIVMGSMFLLNLFVGVLLEQFETRQEEKISVDEKTDYWSKLQPILLTAFPIKLPPVPSHAIGRLCHKIAFSDIFEFVVFGIIFVNTVFLCMHFNGESAEWKEFLTDMNLVFTALFALEALIKIIAMGPRRYFSVHWNKFDFAVVTISIIESFAHFGVAASVFRLLRTGRIVRLIRMSRGVRMLIKTMLIALPSLGNILALLGLLFFIYGALGVQLFSHVKHQTSINDHINFENMGNALLVMFRVMIADSWTAIMSDCSVQPPECSPSAGDCGLPQVAPIFFASFILLATYVLLNLMIAVMLDHFQHVIDEELVPVRENDVVKYVKVWKKYDHHGTYFIRAERVPDFLYDVGLPLGVAAGLRFALVMNILKEARVRDFNGHVYYGDLLKAMTRAAVIRDRLEFKDAPPTFTNTFDAKLSEIVRAMNLDVSMLHENKAAHSNLAELWATLRVQSIVRGFLARLKSAHENRVGHQMIGPSASGVAKKFASSLQHIVSSFDSEDPHSIVEQISTNAGRPTTAAFGSSRSNLFDRTASLILKKMNRKANRGRGTGETSLGAVVMVGIAQNKFRAALMASAQREKSEHLADVSEWAKTDVHSDGENSDFEDEYFEEFRRTRSESTITSTTDTSAGQKSQSFALGKDADFRKETTDLVEFLRWKAEQEKEPPAVVPPSPLSRSSSRLRLPSMLSLFARRSSVAVDSSRSSNPNSNTRRFSIF